MNPLKLAYAVLVFVFALPGLLTVELVEEPMSGGTIVATTLPARHQQLQAWHQSAPAPFNTVPVELIYGCHPSGCHYGNYSHDQIWVSGRAFDAGVARSVLIHELAHAWYADNWHELPKGLTSETWADYATHAVCPECWTHYVKQFNPDLLEQVAERLEQT